MLNRQLILTVVLSLFLGTVASDAVADTHWAVDADGAWHDPAKWTSDPVLPGPNDVVMIDRPNADVTVTFSQGDHTVAGIQSTDGLVITGGTLRVTGMSELNGPFGFAPASSVVSQLIATGPLAQVAINNATILNQGGLQATGGASIIVPHLESYDAGIEANVNWLAEGENSLLSLPELILIDGPQPAFTSFDDDALTISATQGGRIDLSSVSAITAPTGGTTGEANGVIVRAIGPGSTVDLSNLLSFKNNRANSLSSIVVADGGTVLVPQLSEIQAATLTIDGTGNITTDQIASFTAGRLNVTNAALAFPSLTSLRGTRVHLMAGGNVDFSAVTDFAGVGITVESGMTVAFPDSFTLYSAQAAPFFGGHFGTPDVPLRAVGENSVLDLSNLESIGATDHSFFQIEISAEEGGVVDLSQTTTITNFGGAGGTIGRAEGPSVFATGDDSLVDLRSLELFEVRAPTAGSRIHASDGGTIRLGQYTLLQHFGGIGGIVVEVSPTGNLEVGTLEIFRNGGSIQGTGTISGSVINGHIVAPHSADTPALPGVFEISGDFHQNESGRVEIDLGGVTAGSEYEQLLIGGAAELAGGIIVDVVDAGNGLFAPQPGQSFTLIEAGNGVSGQFTGGRLPSLNDGLSWQFTYDATRVLLEVADLLAGDHNASGFVEQADLDLVLLNWGVDATTAPDGWYSDLPQDFVGQRELDRVLLNWGSGAGSNLGSARVPEPTSLSIAALITFAVAIFVRTYSRS